MSCEELDVATETARQAGALGARMTGGGFGGSAIALVPLERADAVETAATTAFAAQGWASRTSSSSNPGRAKRLSDRLSASLPRRPIAGDAAV